MLRDLLRGSVICADADDFAACFRGLEKLVEDKIVDEIVSVKNRVRDGALDSGYAAASGGLDGRREGLVAGTWTRM